MRIVFFSHYFPPEGNAPATRTYDHCVRWVEEFGADVTVITCAPNVPDGAVYEGYRNAWWPQSETIDGIKVVRVWTFLRRNPGKSQLILNYLSFLVSSLLAFVFWVRRPHVLVATTPQFFCGIAGVFASWLKWCPLVLEVRDIWPESIVTVGAIRRGWGIRLLEWLEKWMYRGARNLVTVGPGYRENILGKCDVGDRISIVTNGVDLKQFRALETDFTFRERYAVNDRFVCSYIGTVGRAHGLEVIVHAAKLLKESGRNDIVFLVVGGGATLGSLERMIAEKELQDWIRTTGRLDKSEIPHALAASDCCLVHLTGDDLFQHVIPSKIFETMASQRPIIMGVKGKAREIVLAANSGVPMEPEDHADLAAIVQDLASDPQRTSAMGRRGRQFVSAHFNRDELARDLFQVLCETAKGRSIRLKDRRWESQQASRDRETEREQEVPGESMS